MADAHNPPIFPWKSFFDWSNFDLVCAIFAFLSVGKASPLRTVFIVLMLLTAFGSILNSVRKVARQNPLSLMIYPVAIANAARVGILIICAGLDFGVKFTGVVVQPPEWESLTFNLATLLIQFSGVAGIIALSEAAWRNRSQYDFSWHELRTDIANFAIIVIAIMTFAIMGLALLQLSLFRVVGPSLWP